MSDRERPRSIAGQTTDSGRDAEHWKVHCETCETCVTERERELCGCDPWRVA